jgi:hypothetical protein
MQDFALISIIFAEKTQKVIRNEKEKSVMDKCSFADIGRM